MGRVNGFSYFSQLGRRMAIPASPQYTSQRILSNANFIADLLRPSNGTTKPNTPQWING